ncbi:nose resistant to fluoxetine protein 6-like isoform X1 [Pararge aegeria]|uniref:nose resistant to fluoxetine protein 6-like isoform X1 n=2 Tax=Pararge aegeria TaxID=116150 RepID=UPI0019CFE974|nr:nose resistant to fluoxetine protein 6-like isoform X1 [Pararge aegeria]
MKAISLILLHLLVCQCSGVIYKLNDSDFSRMPPVFHLDDYDHCITNPDGLYCSVDIDVVSDTGSELYSMMKTYSDYNRKHFNHTSLHYGICVTHTCKKFLPINAMSKTLNNTGDLSNTDLQLVLETCLNESLWNHYELKTKIAAPIYCNNIEEQVKDGGHLAVGVFLLVLLTMNVIGTLYDAVFVRGQNRAGNNLLLCFSVPHNFSRLINPYAKLGPREERLKVFHGLRTLTIMSVIFCHSLLPFALAPENVHYVESLYDNIMHFIFLNGTVVVQTFFIISGCLLAYKLELYAENHEINWTLLPKILINTWVKLTPSYMVVLAVTATWLGYAGSGPFWKIAVMREVDDCRIDGWANMLYINNYFDHTQCMVQTWYLASNMQLYILGYVTCILIKRGRCRKAALILLFIVGIITPIAHTYFQNLDAVLMITPETARSFMDNPTFNHVYKRGHTNIFNFVLGIALGFLIYRLQTNEVNMQKYKKYRYLFLLTFPAIAGSMFIGSVFYLDGTSTSIYTKAIYAGLIKPLFGIILAILIIGCVFKIENVYRTILEWNGWKIPGKLSYCAFLLHIALVRIATGSLRTLVPLTNLRMIEITIAFIVMSYLVAIPFWLLVDAPMTEFLQKLLTGSLCQRTEETKEVPDNNIALMNNLKMIDTEKGNSRL